MLENLFGYILKSKDLVNEKSSFQFLKLKSRSGRSGITPLLVFQNGQRLPTYFIKMGWTEDSCIILYTEVEKLMQVRRCLLKCELENTIPEIIGWQEQNGYGILIEKAVIGTPLSALIPSLSLSKINIHVGIIDQCLNWLQDFQGRSIIKKVEFSYISPKIQSEIDFFSKNIAPGFKYFDKIRRLIEQCSNEIIPLCIQHGDFSPYNIIYKAGKITVIDWEGASSSDFSVDFAHFILMYIFQITRLGKNEIERFEKGIMLKGPYQNMIMSKFSLYLQNIGLSSKFIPFMLFWAMLKGANDVYKHSYAYQGHFPPWLDMLNIFMAPL